MQLSQVDSAADFEIQIKLVENESTTGEVLNDTSGDSATVTEERDKSEEWCENLAKQLEEAQVVENLGKQCTRTVKDRVTSPIEGKELESWRGKRRISILLNSIRNQGQKRCFEVKLS